jgi:hypothetical protein
MSSKQLKGNWILETSFSSLIDLQYHTKLAYKCITMQYKIQIHDTK